MATQPPKVETKSNLLTDREKHLVAQIIEAEGRGLPVGTNCMKMVFTQGMVGEMIELSRKLIEEQIIPKPFTSPDWRKTALRQEARPGQHTRGEGERTARLLVYNEDFELLKTAFPDCRLNEAERYAARVAFSSHRS